MQETPVVGLDLSLIGTAGVALRHDGSVGAVLAFVKRAFSSPEERGACFTSLGVDSLTLHPSESLPRGDKVRSWRRTVRVADAVRSWLVGTACPRHVALEDHAFNARGADVYQLGHLHGLVRLSVCRPGDGISAFPFRLYDPASLKVFATGKGNARKEEMTAAAEAAGFRCGLLGREASWNLADAYWCAQAMRTELGVRLGVWALGALSAQAQRLVVNYKDRPLVGLEDR